MPLSPLQKELLAYLQKGSAHISLLDAAKGVPEKAMNTRTDNVPFTPWGLLEHIRITQADMLDFMRNPKYPNQKHKALSWPRDYWPDANKRATKTMWATTLAGYKRDRAAIEAEIIKDPATDFFAPIPHGDGQTIMKELLQILDHTAYHTGEFVTLLRALGVWKKS